MFLGISLISWKSKKQACVSKSSTESEYRAMSAACSEIVWLRGLLAELGFTQSNPTPLHADNTGAIQIAANPVYHERTKHMEVVVIIFAKPLTLEASLGIVTRNFMGFVIQCVHKVVPCDSSIKIECLALLMYVSR
ncbi:hypothetical protein FEM48_Zijuj10G0104000 [Ziziphus jujuba var. spinosa]|uniref:Secreted RxLR effector protein 161-like n=1 Tax=Ziziphus jujuba var. spinosa TaxID=714518 RepID=A0A978UMU2_ZIZJJ|nr:hypothetical protein FEM48_Zijuj10G0104000 [Ziziphus jujuba var. spinosa]